MATDTIKNGNSGNVSIAEVAEYLGVSLVNARRYVEAGMIEGALVIKHKERNTYIIPRHTFDAWRLKSL